MNGEDNSGGKLDNSSIPPGVVPVTKTPVPAENPVKPGTDWIGLVYMIIALFVLIAAFQLYFTIQDLIRTWISDQFVPVFSACYYVVVIVIGVWLIRGYIRKQ
jgi:hypothetical protein